MNYFEQWKSKRETKKVKLSFDAIEKSAFHDKLYCLRQKFQNVTSKVRKMLQVGNDILQIAYPCKEWLDLLIDRRGSVNNE